jgi:transposase
MAHTPETKQRFFELLNGGWSIPKACLKLGINRDTGYDWIKKREAGAMKYLDQKAEDALPNPKLRDELSPEALRALDDFEFFRWRYLGRKSRPWQVEAAEKALEWVNSDETELLVINCPPGSGKSTLFTNDIPIWLICRNRSIRIFLGHRVVKKAQTYARRIRRALERTRPLPPDPAEGRMEAAEGCLAVDYGRFKPRTGDVWRADEFTVLAEFADEESAIENKEATVVANGMGTEFLGDRADYVVWDDLITNSILKSVDQIEDQRTWWDNEGVTRVEPGGALLLCGQRMGPEDLYHHCLTERLPPDDTDHDAIEELSTDEYTEWLERHGETRYRHIIYPAHFEDRCTGEHGKTQEYAYPNGCLLDPYRIPWRGRNGLLAIRANRASKYRVQYQQEDVDPDDILVPRIWIDGGRDSDGIEHPGCLDRHRGLCAAPKGLSQPVYSIATADPSPTQFWSVQWWLYHPASEQRFLMDLHRARMDAPDWLDWNENTKQFYGLAHDWQLRADDLGWPITHWIFEQNAAQRFVLQFDHVKRWQRKVNTQILAHNTTVRKLDEDFGVQMLRDRYRFGNVRLPYLVEDRSFMSSPAKVASDHLIREVTTYPQATYTDCLMAQYFLEYNLPNIAHTPSVRRATRRPGWMRRSA